MIAALAACISPLAFSAGEAWPAEAKGLIAQGRVAPGFTPEMVEAALGKPSRKFSRVADNQNIEIWSWRRFCWPCAPAYDPLIAGAWTSAGLTAYGIEDNEKARVIFFDQKVVEAEIR